MIRRATFARLTLFLSALLWTIQAGAPHLEAADAPVLRHRVEAPLARIIGLEGDRFLLWSSTGEMQVGTVAGQWSPMFRTALHPVDDVAPDAQGILAAASVDVGLSGIVLLDAAGHEQARWTLKEQVFRALAGEHGRFATTRAGMVPLLVGGATGPVAPYLEPATPFHTVPPGPLAAPPNVLRFDPTANPATMIACRPRDFSMQHGAPGRCWKSGPAGWKIVGPFVTPIACDDWLVAFEQDHPARVVVYSMTSGKRALTIPTPVDPQISCIGPAELLVGDSRLSLFRLPERKPVWTSKPMPAPITELAATETAFAYRVRGSLDVIIMPRPRIGTHPSSSAR